MKQGQYEIVLMREDGTPYLEEVVDGQTYAVAEPGAPYHVEVRVKADWRGMFPAKYLRFGLYIDGVDVQYWKRLDLSTCSSSSSGSSSSSTWRSDTLSLRFWGFKKNVNDIRSFVFTHPTFSSSNADELVAQPLGTIKLVVYEARIVEGTFNNHIGVNDFPHEHKVSEAEKFYKVASLITSAGAKVTHERETFMASLSRWENVSSTPLTTLLLRYHAVNTLRILKNIQSGKHPLEGGTSGGSAKKARHESEQTLLETRLGISEEKEANEDTDVIIIQQEKLVPMLDLTDDTAQWEVVSLKKL
jgi:hypothetical protein